MPKFLKSGAILAVLAGLALSLPSSALAADALVQPLPAPDLSKLPAAEVNELRAARENFEKIKPRLVGEGLIEGYAQIGATYARAGLYDIAAVALDNSIALAPKDARWTYARGVIANLAGNTSAARGYFEHALELNPDYLPIRLAVAGQRAQGGDLEGARKLLVDYTTQHKDQPAAYAMLGDIDLRQQHYAVSIEHTKEALKLDPKATSLYKQLADAYSRMGDEKTAADLRKQAGDGAPSLADPIGVGLMPRSASASAAAAKKPAAGDAPRPESVSSAMDEVTLLLAARRYDDARKRLDRALAKFPNNATLLAAYARVEAADGRFDAARSRAEAAVAAAPRNTTIKLVQGFVLEMAGDDGAAQRAYEDALRIDPRYAEARMRLATLLMRTGRADQAVTQYRGIAEADRKNATAWARLVAAEVVTNNCAGALKDVNGALAKDANNPQLLQLFVRVASTCGGADAEEKRMALDYGGKLYKSASDAAPVAEAYALALAANGKWDDAVKTQEAAIFVLVRNGRRGELDDYQTTLKTLREHRLPERPWAPKSVWLAPERPVPDAKTGAG